MDLRRYPSFLTYRKIMMCMLTGLASALSLNVVYAQVSNVTKPLDAVVVVVNGQAISSLELKRREAYLVGQLQRNKQAIPSQQILTEAVLERSIFELLMVQSATKQGLLPSDAMVQQAIADNAFQSGLTLNQFIARVEQSGTNFAEYTLDLKNEMAMASARERALAAKSKVTDLEIDRFLRDSQSGVTQEYAVQALFLPKSESDSALQAASRREQAQAMLVSANKAQTDEAFSEIQKTMVDAAVKHEVSLGFRALNKFPELYSSAIEEMAVGTVSPLLESSAGFYILRLTNKRTILPQVNLIKARHILIRVDGDGAGAGAAEEAAKQTIKKIHDRLTLNINLFAELAKEFSQDGSAANGGDLGWTLPGDMVPEFERVMEVLKEGEMGLPLRSQFGWHIVQVLERKAGDLPKDRLRGQARNVLKARKQDEALGEWLDQLKAQAYIEYKR
jgi:peptidyl-prolyl cis-trans isomerase SurA